MIRNLFMVTGFKMLKRLELSFLGKSEKRKVWYQKSSWTNIIKAIKDMQSVK